MHELAITKELIRIIEQECRKNNIKNPKKITIELGSFTSYEKDPIQYYFDFLKKEKMLLKNSVILIEEVPAKVFCNECKKTSIIQSPVAVFCPECESFDTELVQGENIKIKTISF